MAAMRDSGEAFWYLDALMEGAQRSWGCVWQTLTQGNPLPKDSSRRCFPPGAPIALSLGELRNAYLQRKEGTPRKEGFPS